MNLPNKPRVLAATYNPVSNTKMISFLVDFPTVLLAELRTHRILTQGSLYEHSELIDFNLSANSARAIPHNKYLEKVLDNPFIPIWTKQQKGMSGELHNNQTGLTTMWLNALEGDIKTQYKGLIINEAHKQNVNRILSPYAWTTCIISGTEWDNFFELRCPKYCIFSENIPMEFKSRRELLKYVHTIEAEEFKNQYDNLTEADWQSINKSSAQPEFQIISEMLYDLYQEADWKKSKYHIPFEDEITRLYYNDIVNILDNHTVKGRDVEGNNIYMKVSASMCAKLSYNTQDNEDTLEKHLERANMLIEHKHQEPFSHQAIAMNEDEYFVFHKSMYKRIGQNKIAQEIENGWCYNLRGFISQRYILENY